MKNFLKKYSITKNDNILVACSGGSDSMYLLHELINIKDKKNILVVHFNHKLREKESEHDEKFVINYCKKNGLKYEVGSAKISKISKQNKIGIEEAARIKRYEFLRKIKDKFKARYIFTAHHLDDKIETFMFNLIRGTKLNGLISIEEKNGDILRPLLNLSKDEILKLCKKKKLSYVNDSSNKNTNLLRNHIRIKIIPQFKKINSSYKVAFSRIMDYFSSIKDFFDLEINVRITDSSFFISEFISLPEFLQKEMIRFIYEKTNNGTVGLSEGNIAEVIRFINNKGNYTKKEIKKMSLSKRNGKIYF